MQLNNEQNGTIIRIDKIKEEKVFFSMIENSINCKKITEIEGVGVPFFVERLPKNTEINKDLFPGVTISEEKIETYQAFQAILGLFPDYVYSDDVRNWYIKIGSTGEPTTQRLFIPNRAYDYALRDKDDNTAPFWALWQVISFGTENINSKYSQITDNSIILYLLELLPDHRAVIEMYAFAGVIIEPFEIEPIIT